MAKILVSCFSPIVDNGDHKLFCMYEGFVQSLMEEGNDVLVINTACFLKRPWNGNNETLEDVDD